MENVMEQRPAVVHVITQLELGGAQRNTLYTVGHLNKARFKASLICGPGGALDAEARALGLQVTFVPELQRAIDPLKDWNAVSALKTALMLHRRQTHGPLLVHTHSSKAGVLGRLAARQLRADAVVHTVHGFAFHSQQGVATRLAYQAVERWVAPMTDAMLFVSKADLSTAEQMGLVALEGGHLVRSGISLGGFLRDAAARKNIRAELNIPDDAKVVVTTANFKAQKNPLLALRAFAHAAAAIPSLHWIFVGDGELRHAFEAQVNHLNLNARVHLTGWRNDIVQLLSAGDVYLLGSDHEGLPRSVLEALSVGLPVVATRAGGTEEVVTPDVGKLVNVGDADGLGAALLATLQSPPQDVAVKAAGALKEFDIDEMVHAQERIYEWLVKTPPVR